jgi:WD40 repeat protein
MKPVFLGLLAVLTAGVGGALADEKDRPRVDGRGDLLPPGALARLGNSGPSIGKAPFSSPCLAFSPDGKSLVRDAEDALVFLDLTTGKERSRLENKGRTTWGMAFSPDGKLLAATGVLESVFAATGVRIWDLSTGKILPQWRWTANDAMDTNHKAGPGCCRCLAFSTDGKMLATAHHECVHLWDVATGKEIRKIGGLAEYIGALAFSADGKNLAVMDTCVSGGWQTPRGTPARLFDVATGKERLRFGEQLNLALYHLAFSPDGKVLATAHTGLIVLWDAATAKEIRRIEIPLENKIRARKAGVDAVAFSPDGKLLASLEDGEVHRIRLWDVDPVNGYPGKELRSVKARLHGGSGIYPASLSFSPDGKLLTSTAGDWKGHALWDVATGEEWPAFEGHRREVKSVAFTADGSRLVSGSSSWAGDDRTSDNTILIWNTKTGRLDKRFDAGYHIGCFALSPDGKNLALGDYLKPIRFIDTATGEDRFSVEGSGDPRGHDKDDSLTDTRSCLFTPDGQMLISLHGRRAIHLWDSLNGRELRLPFTGFKPGRWVIRTAVKGSITGLAFSADSKVLFTASEEFPEQSDTKPPLEYAIRQWDLMTGKELRHFEVRAYGISLSRDGGLLAFVDHERGVRLWDLTTEEELLRIKGHQQGITRVALSPSGKVLATLGFDDSDVILWDTATGKELRRLTGHRGEVHDLAFAPDGKVLATAGADTTILLWDMAELSK